MAERMITTGTIAIWRPKSKQEKDKKDPRGSERLPSLENSHPKRSGPWIHEIGKSQDNGLKLRNSRNMELLNCNRNSRIDEFEMNTKIWFAAGGKVNIGIKIKRRSITKKRKRSK